MTSFLGLAMGEEVLNGKEGTTRTKKLIKCGTRVSSTIVSYIFFRDFDLSLFLRDWIPTSL